MAEPSPTTGLGGRPRPKRALVFSGGGARGADLLSYLLFDGEFLAPLAELGYHDARSHENELAAFFSDEPFEPDL